MAAIWQQCALLPSPLSRQFRTRLASAALPRRQLVSVRAQQKVQQEESKSKQEEQPQKPLPPDYEPPPLLPGDPGYVPDFWEGPQWNWLGFTLQYLWAIGILVAVVVCGILLLTYKPRPGEFEQPEVVQTPKLEDIKRYLNNRKSGSEQEPQEAPALSTPSTTEAQ